MKNPNKQTAFTSIAALGALGAASTASAVITHVNSPVELANDGDIWFLEGAGGSTKLASMAVSTTGIVSFQKPGGSSNNFQFAESGNFSGLYVKALVSGAAVSAGIFDNPGTYLGGDTSQGRYAINTAGDLTTNGAWGDHFDLGTQAYAGFRFDTGSGVQYGWVSLTWQNDGDLIIHEWAYADVGESINVGAVPEPETVASALGLLALGAAGMRRYQNRKRLSANA